MTKMRNITEQERTALEAQGCSAEQWSKVLVSSCFEVAQMRNVTLEGEVQIAPHAIVTDSHIANYNIGEGALVQSVTRLECRTSSSFGNGTPVATINENGGRSVEIYEQMTAQVAYAWAIYRHRTQFTQKMQSLVQRYAEQKRAKMGHVGAGAKIIGARFIRETNIAEGAVVEGAALVENATLLQGAYLGVDVQVKDAIVAEGATIDSGALVQRCFIGEQAIVAKGFTALDSLIFAMSHLEGGEAVSIFAGPCTVSHHKSTLLIAGIFSLFNAGSGANQSNHLFKGGPRHQAVHGRGVKFASGAYILSPAREGAFTMVKGQLCNHHDTDIFPLSYLIGDGKSTQLLPGRNITSYGTARDLEKWPARDQRAVKRDMVSYELWSPYIVSKMIRGLNALHTIAEGECGPEGCYSHERVLIAPRHLERGIELYNKAIAAALGKMLQRGQGVQGAAEIAGAEGEWIDMGGAMMPQQFVEQILDGVQSGTYGDLQQIEQQFRAFAEVEDRAVRCWALKMLTQLMGHEPTREDMESAIAAAEQSQEQLHQLQQRDRESEEGAEGVEGVEGAEGSQQMMVGYGNDTTDAATQRADFEAVQGRR